MTFHGRVFSSLVLLSVVASASAHAGTYADDLVGELYAMKSVYSSEYAPAQWKKSYANYDLASSFSAALAAIQANPNLTQKQGREILKSFIYAMKDYHTSISFVSTEIATLPFSVKGTDSKFFIMYIDRNKLPESAFPFHVGDELVNFGGIPTVQAIAQVQAETPANVPSTDKALAEFYLTRRSAARGLDVPQGPVTITVKAKGTDAAVDYQMHWDYTPEKVQPRGNLGVSDVLHASSENTLHIVSPRMDVKVADAPSNDNPYDLGARKTFTPDLGTKIWASADADLFYAYIYMTADRKLVGYLRLPEYEAPDYGKAVAEFGRDIALFESTTDSMIIDQVNNPGGSVFYLYSLASMLATSPLHTPLHRMSITQADVMEATKAIDQLAAVTSDADAKKLIGVDNTDGYPVSYEFAQFQLGNARFEVSEWNAGRKLSNPYWIGGVDHINPAETHYTKPILLLVNGLDFSGGDFFPSIMQDNKRVTVMGSRTAGAGGYVVDVPVPNNVDVNAFRCTESIAERINQNPIENLGVTPDVVYQMTENDFQNGYADYVKAIQATVGK
jgi:hypothetical protein